jgi:type I restriction enzyme S subunit
MRSTSTTKIDWLKGLSLPSDWSESKVKYVAPGMQAGEAITAESIEPAGTYPVYGGNGLRGYTEAKTHHGTRILIGRQGALCGNVHLISGEFWASEHAIVARAAGTVHPRWLAHILRVMNLGQYSQTAAQPGIGTAQINALPVPVPPLSEQRAIADYLERETARIDTLIEEQQRLIEMLRERRVATIAGALDGYEMTRLRRLVDHRRPMTYGILQCGEPVDGGVAYIGPSDITGEGVSPELEVLRTTTPEIASAYQRSVLVGGDVVVSIGPAYGKVAVVSDSLSGANLTQDTVRVALRPDLVDTRFVVWALLSRQTSEYWDYQIMGATFRRLNLGTLARTPIPLPSIDVQRSIAAYLDQQTAKIDMLVAETERFIKLARERRSALITAAVTGQIDVRKMA